LAKVCKTSCQRSRGEEENFAWFPKKKVQIAARKLSGDNPGTDDLFSSILSAHICVQELNESIHAGHITKGLIPNCVGDPTFNIRAKVKERCSSAKEQVTVWLNKLLIRIFCQELLWLGTLGLDRCIGIYN